MKTAQEIMSRDVFTVRTDMPLDELAREFSEKRVSGFPVLGSAGELVGVVTESDLIHQNQRLHIPTTFALLDSVIVLGSSKRMEEEFRRVAATTVEEIMTREPLTISPETPASEIAAIMADRHIHTLPVTDDEGRLLGIIGKLDVIRAIATP
jgi:CBS-domain-containing membrane protein